MGLFDIINAIALRLMMSTRIKVLPPEVANAIAAGEVIERPANAVRELIENSIDSNASQILLDEVDAGRSLLRITDNGDGMSLADLELCAQRHATSKIDQFADLDKLSSLGFRGEALASIAAVSVMKIASRELSAEHGWLYLPSQATSKRWNMNPGTMVEVHEIFTKLPARARYLKSIQTERARISEAFCDIACCYPLIEMQLQQNSKYKYQLAAVVEIESEHQALEARLLQIYPHLSTALISLEKSNDLFSLSFWMIDPNATNRYRQSGRCYLNGRLVRNRLLHKAVCDAMQGYLHGNEIPGYFLHMHMPANLLDVNVHPTKSEVRFVESQLVYQFIYQAIKQHFTKPLGKSLGAEQLNNYFATQQQSAQPSFAEATRSSTPHIAPASPASKASVASENKPMDVQSRLAQLFSVATSSNENKADAAESRHLQNPDLNNADLANLTNACAVPELNHNQQLVANSGYLGEAIGTIGKVYLLAENQHGLIIVDMHAAHERLLLEQFSKLWHKQRKLPSQGVLISQEINFNDVEINSLIQLQEILEELSFSFSAIDNVVTINTVPALLPANVNIAELFSEFAKLGDLIGVGAVENWRETMIREILSVCACHGAYRAREQMASVQHTQLLRRMEQTPSSGFCNHGRPCWLQLEMQYLDKLFKRGR